MSHVSVHIHGDIRLPFEFVESNYFTALAEKILQLLDKRTDMVAIILCTNREIQEINRQYRNKDYPTDVISFAYNDVSFPGESPENSHAGDIFISLEKAKEQSLEYELSFQDEIKRLLVHAILHLYGFDHETGEQKARVMFQKEDEIISKLAESPLL